MRRAYSILLVLCLVVSVLPFGTFATEIVSSGSCGANVNWTLDVDGLLTISGSGEMNNYDYTSRSPFYGNSEINSVSIMSGVTSIGNDAFNSCYNLQSVLFSNSLSSIGEYAFSDCTGLNKLEIPGNILKIGDFAFSNCRSLDSVSIQHGVERLGNNAFYGCTNLLSFIIPESVISVGDGVFSECTNLKTASIPDSLTCISSSMFNNCHSLSYIDIPESISEIQPYAFNGCSKLNSINLPDSISKIGSSAFQNCTNLSSIVIPDGVLEIASLMFCGCNSLTDVSLPQSVEFISFSAFEDCCSLRKIEIPNNVYSISNNTFRNCTALNEITIPQSVLFIRAHAFENCTALKRITVPHGDLEEYVFCGCSSLEHVTMQEGKTIGAYALGNCPKLSTVNLPYTLTDVDSNAFRNSSALTDIYYSGLRRQWAEIKIRNTGNDPLLKAKIHVVEFNDIKEKDYYFEPVLWAVNQTPQITNGTSVNKYSPNATCTRGQVVTFLWRANGCPEPMNMNNPFKDVQTKDYFYKAVLWAAEKGVTNGMDATHFNPEGACTRAHVVTFLWRADGRPSYGEYYPFFSDIKPNQYYTNAVIWAVEHWITNGTSDTTFSPDSPCTRAQVVTFLYRDHVQ